MEILLNTWGKEIEEKLYEIPCHVQKIQCLQESLLRRLKYQRLNQSLTSRIITYIQQKKGLINIPGVCTATNVHYKKLERLFYTEVGLSPKTFIRITRFQEVFKKIRQQGVKDLTGLAYEYGYYDQSHFIRDFQAFSGVNPRKFFSEKNFIAEMITSPPEQVLV